MTSDGLPQRHQQPRDLSRLVVILGTVVSLVAVAGCSIAAYLLVNQQDVLDSIQQSRVQNTFDACEEEKDRNEAAIAKYDENIAAAKKAGLLTKEQQTRLEQSRAFTVGLIDALAPAQDCRELAAARFPDDLVRKVLP